jgi:CarD family transcriptional regulator
MFAIGDKVMHPRFGAGKITGESHRELVAGYANYFVIEVVGTGATAYVPMQKMDELGVRAVMSVAELAKVLARLCSDPKLLSSDYKQRQARIEELLKTHQPVTLAEVIRDLTWHRRRKHLTQKDEALLNRGRELLASEMALATDAPIADVHAAIDAVLTVTKPGPSDENTDPTQRSQVPTTSPEALVRELLDRVAG